MKKAEQTQSFVCHPSYYDAVLAIKNEAVQTRMLKAIFSYGCFNDIPDFSDIDPMGALDCAFSQIKDQIDRDREKWYDKAKKRSEAGKKGGAPRGNKNACKTQNKQKQAKTSKTSIDVDVDVDIDVDVDVERDIKSLQANQKVSPTTHAEDKERFSKFCEYYLSPDREEFRNIHKKKYGIDDLKTAFEEFYELCVERDVLPEILNVKDFEKKFRFLYCIPLNEKRFSMPQGTIPERKERFKEEVTRLLDSTKDAYGQYVYTPEMCTAFFRYWTELSRDGTLMRFEEQNFWETSKRLKSWKEKMQP